jgi:hypothetical protein
LGFEGEGIPLGFLGLAVIEEVLGFEYAFIVDEVEEGVSLITTAGLST